MRTNSYSALDFMYWVLENVEENYAASEGALFLASEDNDLMQAVIVETAQVCGVQTPRTFSALMAKAERYGTVTTPTDAFKRRGAILHRKGILHVSVGDGARAVALDRDGLVSLYSFGVNDHDPEYWDGAFELPELRYS